MIDTPGKTCTLESLAPEFRKDMEAARTRLNNEQAIVAERLVSFIESQFPGAKYVHVRFTEKGFTAHYLTPYLIKTPANKRKSSIVMCREESPANIREWIASQREANSKLEQVFMDMGAGFFSAPADPATYHTGSHSFNIQGYCKTTMIVDIDFAKLREGTARLLGRSPSAT